MAQSLAINARPAKPSPSLKAASLSERTSPEIVFGLVGAVGSGVTRTAGLLKDILQTSYGYEAENVKASNLIAASAPLVGETFSAGLKGGTRADRLQTIGNKLRAELSNTYVMEKCVEAIALRRLERGYSKEQEPYVAQPRKQATIIDSIKHPDEVKLLRDVYGDVFWLIAVFAPWDIRERRLLNDGVTQDDITKISIRDEDEAVVHGQKVRNTAYLADFLSAMLVKTTPS